MSETGELEKAGRCCTHIPLLPRISGSVRLFQWYFESDWGTGEGREVLHTKIPAFQDQWFSQVVLMVF